MNIYQTISAVMNEIGAIGKTSKNQTQGFMFRGIDAVYNAISPALQKYKLFIVPEILENSREERTTFKGGTLIYSICKIKYTFYAEDGSSITATVIGEGMDSGDKATNKAMSIAFKYACFQVFCIPTEEMVDPDSESHEVKPRQQKKPAAGKPDPKPAPAAVLEEDKKITPQEADVLKLKAENDDVSEHLIESLYKVAKIEDLTQKKLENIYKFWDKIVEKAMEQKNGMETNQ